MAGYDPLAFGRELRTHRLKLGWSASQLSELYAGFVGRDDSPPGPTFIYHLERGTTMVSLERRAILASLVGMPLAFVDVFQQETSKNIDIAEYTRSLELYCNEWREGTLQQEAGAIQERANRLEAVSFQAFGQEKRTLLELLGFYQIMHADAWGGQSPVLAYDILSSAVERARQEKFPAIHVHALTQRAGIVIGRFETSKDPATIQTVIDDYASAAQEESKLSPFYRGLLCVRKGVLDAYIARDKKEFTDALHLLTKGSSQIGLSTDDIRIVARLDYERYMLNRAAAYLYSPMGNPGLALASLNELDRRCPGSKGKNRLAYRNRLFAEAYLATGDYPMVAAHLEAALETAYGGEISRLVEIHTRLKSTSYWNDPDVGRIAVKINQVRYPDLFC